MQRRLAAYQAQHDILAISLRDLQDQQTILSVAPQYQDAVRAAVDAYNKSIQTMTDLHGKVYTSLEELKAALAEQIPEYQRNKQAVHDISEAYK